MSDSESNALDIKKENVIKNKSFSFALKIVSLCKNLVETKKEFILSKQLLRSGTAIGALIRESEHAESKLDFIHKMSIAQKEANETDYWIELLFQSNYISKDEYSDCMSSLESIRKIISAIIVTSKRKIK